MACPQARVCPVSQVYTPVGLVLDLDLRDSLGYE
jgi:hypothetical protein